MRLLVIVKKQGLVRWHGYDGGPNVGVKSLYVARINAEHQNRVVSARGTHGVYILAVYIAKIVFPEAIRLEGEAKIHLSFKDIDELYVLMQMQRIA